MGKRDPVHIPFEELRNCPKCGGHRLRKVHDQKYGGQEGIYRLVIYKCERGHETPKRQLVVRQFNVPPKEQWEGWT